MVEHLYVQTYLNIAENSMIERKLCINVVLLNHNLYI